MDLTPVFTVLPADQEIVQPTPISAAGSQPVGGFVASPNSLSQGSISINGTAQTILIGAATSPTAGIGIFMGSDGQLSPGYDFRVGDPSGHYIWWDASANTLSIVGAVSASSIDIPDTVTASSFHVDSLGNTWWGANVASGLSTAKASIDKDGNAVFKSVSIGGVATQYVITNSGIFSYGDGSDGSAHIVANATLTSDKYYTDLTIDNGAILNPGGYRIFVSGTLTLGSATTAGGGGISRDGASGSNASGGTQGSGGSALADGYLKGSLAGADGGGGGAISSGNLNGNQGGSSSGVGTSNSIGSSSNAGGGGGNGGSGFGTGGGSIGLGGGGSSGATATPSNVKLIANWHLATLLDITSSGSTIKYDNSASAPGGGGGANGGGSNFGLGNGGGQGGGGGGGGTAGGIVAIYARNIVMYQGLSGPNYAGTVANVSNSGSIWQNPTNAQGAPNGTGATNSVVHFVQDDYLTASNYGFAVVTGETIKGIQVTFRCKNSGANPITFATVQLLNAGTKVGSNLAAGTLAAGSAYADVTFGGPTNLWGSTWAAADINNAGFGAAVNFASASGSGTADVDSISITVYTSGGFISANGGNGGNGANGGNAGGSGGQAAGGGGGGGGGAGGNGGQIIMTYNQLSGTGTANIFANGGLGGTKGTKGLKINTGTDGQDGANGSNGNAGNIRQFQLSL